ncbi:MAG: arginine deiminase family protein [Pseudomonadota bacterium]
MSKPFGAQDMVSSLARVIVKSPSPSMAAADSQQWHYGTGLTQAALDAQHAEFVSVLSESGAEVIQLNGASDDLCDAIFPHDPSLVCDAGAIILRMGKELRRPEPDAHKHTYDEIGIPVIGTIESPGTVEGGDCVWLNGDTLIVGRGFRTNQSGIDQLKSILEPRGVSVLVYDLPVLSGEAACLHLMSIISILDHDLALIYKPLMPVAFYQMLQDKGVVLVEGDVDEFERSNGLNLNVLATRPRDCIAVAGFPKTVAAMRAAGCQVQTFNGDDLCIKCEGGPTCLTRPVLRRQ